MSTPGQQSENDEPVRENPGQDNEQTADPAEGDPEVILIATGSELAMTVDAYEQLTADGIRARVVSMPSM